MVALQPARARQLSAFGAETVDESRLRAAAGGTVSTALVVTPFCAAGAEGSFLLALAAAGLVGSVVAWLVERRRPASRPAVRYAVVGAVLAAVVALVLGWPDFAYLLPSLVVAVPVGAVGGAVAALVAVRLPARLLLRAVCLGAVVLVAAGAVAVERTRPWLSGSYLLVEGPSTAGSASALAERVSAGLRAEPDPLSDAAWGRVASSVVGTKAGGRVRTGYDRDRDSRVITVRVDDDRACVVVQGRTVRSLPGDCP